MANKRGTIQKRERRHSDSPLSLHKTIVSAAGECIEDGISGLTFQRVSDKVGVSRQTVHNYFPTKELLLGEVILDYMLTGIASVLDKLDFNQPPSKVVRNGIRRMVVYMGQPRGRAMLDPAYREICARAADTKDIVNIFVVNFWLPILDRIKETGHLRQDVSTKDIGKWLFMIYYAVLTSQLLSPKDLDRMIETFVVPSIIGTGA